MALQQDIVSRIVRVNWPAGDWLVISWENRSGKRVQSGESGPPFLEAFLTEFPLLEDVNICTPDFKLRKVGSEKDPPVAQTITADMRANLVAWSYPQYQDLQQDITTVEADTYEIWYYWLVVNGTYVTTFAIGPFHNGTEATAWAKANYRGISIGSNFPYANVPEENVGAVPAPYGWQDAEVLATLHTETTTYIEYDLKEAGVFIVNTSAITAAMSNPNSPAYRPNKDSRKKVEFKINFPGTLDWKNYYRWKMKFELFKPKKLDYPVDGENKPAWDADDRLDVIEFEAIAGEESPQEAAQLNMELDLKNHKITGTVQDDLGAYIP